MVLLVSFHPNEVWGLAPCGVLGFLGRAPDQGDLGKAVLKLKLIAF